MQHVSEEILPGSNLHVLYNSISFPDPNSKVSCPYLMKSTLDHAIAITNWNFFFCVCEQTVRNTSSLKSLVLEDQAVQIVHDESELELAEEVGFV